MNALGVHLKTGDFWWAFIRGRRLLEVGVYFKILENSENRIGTYKTENIHFLLSMLYLLLYNSVIDQHSLPGTQQTR